jgi:hypothetical protein
VVVTHDGRPVLAGLGDAAATHGPADDVRDLAATCLRALGEAADGAEAADVEPGSRESVRRVLAAVTDARSAPDARGLSRALFAAAVARPVRPVGEDRSSPATARAPTVPGGRSGRHRAPAEGRRPRPAATAVAAVAAAVVVTAAAGAGARWAVVDDLPAPARVPAGADGWRGVLGDLDDLRAEAFATADLGALGEVYAADGPALSRDRAAMTRLAHAGLRAEGMRLATVEVTERSRAPGRVRLRVADVLRSYRLVDRAGRVVDVRAGRGLRRWTVTLARAGGRWKVYDVARE